MLAHLKRRPDQQRTETDRDNQCNKVRETVKLQQLRHLFEALATEASVRGHDRIYWNKQQQQTDL